jgi:hypothetical protein
VLHAAARLVRGGRKRRLRIQASWPWAEAITAAWQRIDALMQGPLTSPKPSLRSRKENPGASRPEPGKILADLAVAMALGGDCLADTHPDRRLLRSRGSLIQ